MKQQKMRQLAAGALALALLTGCGMGAADPDDLAYQAADIRRDQALFTVDGEEVAAGEYLFWLSSAIAEEKYYGYFSDDSAWEETLYDGTPTAEGLKADAMETAKLYRIIRTKAAEMGVEVTDEQRQEAEEDLQQTEEQFGGADAFQQLLDSYCVTREEFVSINEVAYLYQGIRDKLEAEGQLTVTDADVEQFLADKGIYAAKHILIATRHMNEDGSYTEFTDEERAAAKQKAQDLREQLRESGDSEEKFDELMAAYSDDGRDENGDLYYPDGYTYVYPAASATYGQLAMVTEFEEGALALEIGQISDPIETDYGYHIILRISPDEAAARAECTEDYKMDALIQSWIDGAQVVTTKAYDSLDPHSYYVRLQAAVEERWAAQPEESPAEGDEGGENDGQETAPTE